MSGIEPGKYTARIKEYGLTESKNKTLQAVVEFEFADKEGEVKELAWFSSFKEGKGREITIDALLVCGLNNNLASISDFEKFNAGNGSGVLDQEKDIAITIEMTNKWKDGKETTEKIPTIAWVNEMGGGALREKLAKEDLVKMMPGLNFGGEIAKARAEKGGTTTATKKPLENFAPSSIEDVPKTDLKEQLPW